MKNLMLHRRPTEMYSAFSQDFQMIHMHTNFLEATVLLHLYQKNFPRLEQSSLMTTGQKIT